MENPGGGGGGSTVKTPGTENSAGWGVKLEKPLVGVGIFSGTTQIKFDADFSKEQKKVNSHLRF